MVYIGAGAKGAVRPRSVSASSSDETSSPDGGKAAAAAALPGPAETGPLAGVRSERAGEAFDSLPPTHETLLTEPVLLNDLPPIPPSAKAKVQGLTLFPGKNGATIEVQGFNETKGRYRVKFDSDGSFGLLKPENILVVSPSPFSSGMDVHDQAQKRFDNFWAAKRAEEALETEKWRIDISKMQGAACRETRGRTKEFVTSEMGLAEQLIMERRQNHEAIERLGPEPRAPGTERPVVCPHTSGNWTRSKLVLFSSPAASGSSQH